MLRRRARVATTETILAGGLPSITPGTGGAEVTDVLGIIAVFDGGGTPVPVGKQVDVPVDAACTLEAWTIVCDASSTTRVDVWRDALGAYPPTAADSMPGAAADRPQTVAASSARDLVTDWDRVIVDAGDVLRFNVDTNNNAARITVALKARRAS
ncbi:MAG TPA: hypothetical protein VGR85_03120 [Candidatus Limnocylindria bacterium]|nr:hypothetical protein [Candidatus Limnocylindria bacterium]